MTGSARGSSASRERSATRSALVVVQVALALVLVVSAALMIRTFQALRDVDPGFSDPATIQTARIWIPSTLFSDSEQVTRMQHEILDRIAALPGVASAGFASDLPMSGEQNNGVVLVEGETIAAGDARPQRRWNFVSPGYFEAMGTRMLAGRDVTWSDIDAGGPGALIALFLGSVGIYGVLSYVVSTRTTEIGVRAALGASPGVVRRMILWQGMRLAVIGVLVGLIAAVALGRVMLAQLYGVSPVDAVTLVAGSAIFLTVAAVASLLPAARAARTAPVEALRAG